MDSRDYSKMIPLKVLGISYSQIQSGAFALILAEVNGPYRIPVVIGAPEAQSIHLCMEKVITPRPLTHDLFVSLMHAYGLQLLDVFIYKFHDGIFSAELAFEDLKGDKVILDSRTSDAIALALRVGCSIYTTQAIIDETGFIMEIENENEEDDDADEQAADGAPAFSEQQAQKHPKLENYSIEELERTLARLIEQEDYEEAAKVNEILRRKRDNK